MSDCVVQRDQNLHFPGDFPCSHCKRIPRNPIQNWCGHRFCETCINVLIRTNDTQPSVCPQCTEDKKVYVDWSYLTREKVFPDRALMRMKIRCPSYGCKWTGEFRLYEEHRAFCEEHKTECFNMQKEGEKEKDDCGTNIFISLFKKAFCIPSRKRLPVSKQESEYNRT